MHINGYISSCTKQQMILALYIFPCGQLAYALYISQEDPFNSLLNSTIQNIFNTSELGQAAKNTFFIYLHLNHINMLIIVHFSYHMHD